MSDSGIPAVELEGAFHQAKKQKHEEESNMDLGFASRYVVWTKEEDEALKRLVESLGAKNWAKIAENMPNRTSKSCRLRWLNQLRPNVQTGGFTAEEDDLIIRTQAEVGNKWTAIAALLPGRTDNAVKNRWNSALKKRAEQQQQVRGAQPSSAPGCTADDSSQWHGSGMTPVTQSTRDGEGLSKATIQSHDFWNGSRPTGGGNRACFWPPTSMAMVANAPPLHLPMPLLSLQPQMSTEEAKAALASANFDVLKKVAPRDPNHTGFHVTVTSTAMVSTAPPPMVMGGSMGGSSSMLQRQQHSTLVHHLMASSRTFSSQRVGGAGAAAVATSSAMVSSTPPPAILSSVPHSTQLHGPSITLPLSGSPRPPAVSWQIPPFLASTSLAVQRKLPEERPSAAGDSREERQEGDSRAENSECPSSSEAAVLKAGTITAVGDLQQGRTGPLGQPTGDLAHLLLLQQQQLMQQQSMLQHLTSQLGQVRPENVISSSLPSQSPLEVQPPQPAVAQIISAAANNSLWPVTSSSAAPLFQHQGQQGDMSSSLGVLSALLSSGGPEALNHLVTLGLGTLMAAAAMRQQVGGPPSADTLAAAQLHVAAQASTQAILSSLLGAASTAQCQSSTLDGDLEGAVLNHHPQASGRQPAMLVDEQGSRLGLGGEGRTSSGSGSLGGRSSSGGSGAGMQNASIGVGLGLLGTPLGSMSDLLGLLAAPAAGGGGLQPASSPTAAGMLGHSPSGLGMMNRFNSGGLTRIDSMFGLSDLI